MTEEVARLTREGKRVMFAVSSTGEVERLADVFNEYNLSFRIGSRTPRPGSEVYVDESTYFAEEMAATDHRESIRARGRSVARSEPGSLRRA